MGAEHPVCRPAPDRCNPVTEEAGASAERYCVVTRHRLSQDTEVLVVSGCIKRFIGRIHPACRQLSGH